MGDDTDRGYNYSALLVPEGTTRVIGKTTDGIDIVSIPMNQIALLWWPGDVHQGDIASLYAETPSGQIDLIQR